MIMWQGFTIQIEWNRQCYGFGKLVVAIVVVVVIFMGMLGVHTRWHTLPEAKVLEDATEVLDDR